MVDTEVEETLREIRERVRAERAALAAAESATRPAAPLAPDGDARDAELPATREDAEARDALARMDANLATAERAWNRLPPLMSNRSGRVARLELWVKRKIKRAAHWFTWEQVNFNAAVHHALRDTRAALEACQRRLEDLQAAHDANARAEAEERHRLAVRLDIAEARGDEMRALASSLERGLGEAGEALRREADALRRETEAARHEAGAARRDAAAADEALGDELRERVAHVLEEQRVTLRQLAIEAGERAAMQDRARRRTEARLEEISRAVTGDK